MATLPQPDRESTPQTNIRLAENPTLPDPETLARRFTRLGKGILDAHSEALGEITSSDDPRINSFDWQTWSRLGQESISLAQTIHFNTDKLQVLPPPDSSTERPDRLRFWDGVEVKEPKHGHGLMSEWAATTLERFKGQPLTAIDLAKVLYGHMFRSREISDLRMRANNVLKTDTVSELLKKKGLELTGINHEGKKVYVCKEISEELEFSYDNGPSDDELRQFAILLREEEQARADGETSNGAGYPDHFLPSPEEAVHALGIKAAKQVIKMLPPEGLEKLEEMSFRLGDPELLSFLLRAKVITRSAFKKREVGLNAVALALAVRTKDGHDLFNGKVSQERIMAFSKAVDSELADRAKAVADSRRGGSGR